MILLHTVRLHAQDNAARVAELNNRLEQAVLDTQRANIMNALSFELRRTDTAQAYNYAKEALKLSTRESYPSGEAASYANFAEYNRTKNRPDLALENYHKAVDIYTDIGNKREACKVYNKIGVVHQGLGDYEEALDYFKRSLDLNKELGDKQACAGSYNNMGNIYYLLGDYSGALENYLASLNIREQLGDKAGIAGSYNNIGNLYNEQHKYSRALDYYMRGLQVREELNDQKGLAKAYTNIGALYYSMKSHKEAMKYYEKALQTSIALGDKQQLAILYVNIGHLSRDQENYSDAIENYTRARNLYTEMGDKRGLATCYNSLGLLYIRLKNYGTAIVNLEKALSIAEQIGAREEVKNAYSSLAAAAEGKGDYKLANNYNKKFIHLKDSIYNEEFAQKLSEMETKYRTGKKQKEIDLLRKEKEIQDIKQERDLERNRVLAYVSTASAVLLLILVAVILRNNRQKQNTNQMLTEQNRKISRQKEEKEVLLKEVHHRVKNNLQVISSLLSLQSVHISDPEIASLFTDCQNRVRSMALIHEKLYTAKDLSKVEIQNYIRSLAENLLGTYRLTKNITIDLQLSVNFFGISTLIPVGLLLNELISNSLKHAFTDHHTSGVITVKISPLGNDRYEMIVGDNGKGMSSSALGSSSSLGLELVHTFVEQLEGSIERLNVPGTVFKIIFIDIDSVHHRRQVPEAAVAG